MFTMRGHHRSMSTLELATFSSFTSQTDVTSTRLFLTETSCFPANLQLLRDHASPRQRPAHIHSSADSATAVTWATAPAVGTAMPEILVRLEDYIDGKHRRGVCVFRIDVQKFLEKEVAGGGDL